MANATIFQQYLQPQRGVSDYLADYDKRDLQQLQLQGQQRQNALAALMYGQQVQDARAKADESNALRRITSGWGADTTDDQRIASLRAAGMPGLMDRADTLEKQALERQKAKATVGKDNAETLKQHLEALKFIAGGVMANPTLENATAAVGMWERLTGREAPEDRAALAQLKTPEQVRQWAASHALKAEELLPQVQIRNTGGTTDTLAIDRLTGKPTVTSSIRNTQSPDSAASVAATIRGQNLTDARARETQAAADRAVTYQQGDDGSFVALPTRIAPGQAVRGVPVMGADGKPLQGKSNVTEDQAKAAGWLVQADNAWANMQKALTASPTAAKPSILPAGSKIRNMMATPEERQFTQAASSLSEALLRAATGAGVNKDEASQKIAELTPVWGDDEDTQQQKRDAIPIYLESLKVRSGRAGEQARAAVAKLPKPGGDQQPAQIKGDADYAALPSGALFVGPDGKTRRKP